MDSAMTKIVSYKCQICHQELGKELVTGLYWTSGPKGKDELVFKPAPNSENHICNHCLNALDTALQTPKILES